MLLIASPISANEGLSDDGEIKGRSTLSIVSSLRENGILATRVEEWGSAIRVFRDGDTGVLLVDKDTLRPLAVVASEPLAIDKRDDPTRGKFDEERSSLVESGDD
jgi:hypothetical protein